MGILVSVVAASLFVAAVATAADWVWASQLLKHKALYGLLHGAGMLGAMGLAIGMTQRRPFTGLAGGLVGRTGVSGLLGCGHRWGPGGTDRAGRGLPEGPALGRLGAGSGAHGWRRDGDPQHRRQRRHPTCRLTGRGEQGVGG